jgi:transglutaminase-like putative cysteine protease
MHAHRLTCLLTGSLVLLGAGAVIVSHAVAPPFAVLLLGFAALGAVMDLRSRYPLSSWALNVLTVGGLLVALALPGPAGPIGRLLAGAIVLLGGKLLAPKSTRDELQILLLCLILLIGAAIVSADVSFALLFFLFLACALATLTWLPFAAHLGRGAVPGTLIRGLAVVGFGLFAVSIPLTAGIFAALPRGTQPVTRRTGSASAISGFSDRVTLGDVGRIAQSDQVAFRAEILEGHGPLDSPPYWRALVLEDTDSMTWATVPWPKVALAAPVQGPLVRQRITMEPTGRTFLVAMDRPRDFSDGWPETSLVGGRVLESERVLDRRTRYEVTSDDSLWSAEPLTSEERARTLIVPPATPASLIAKAQEVTAGETSAESRAQALLEHFRTGGYRYSLDGPGAGGHPLDALLRTRKGFCEHYASALVLMLREVGVRSEERRVGKECS